MKIFAKITLFISLICVGFAPTAYAASSSYEGEYAPISAKFKLVAGPDFSANCTTTTISELIKRAGSKKEKKVTKSVRSIKEINGISIFNLDADLGSGNKFKAESNINAKGHFGPLSVSFSGPDFRGATSEDRRQLEEVLKDALVEKEFSGKEIYQGKKFDTAFIIRTLDRLFQAQDNGAQSRKSKGFIKVLGETETQYGPSVVVSANLDYNVAARGSVITIKYEGYYLIHKASGLVYEWKTENKMSARGRVFLKANEHNKCIVSGSPKVQASAQETISEKNGSNANPPAAPITTKSDTKDSDNSIESQLTKVKDLLKKGLITESEASEKRKQILEKI